LKVCFYAYGSLPIHSQSLEERPLGGTETGLIRVADIFAAKGYQVLVVTSHPNPHIYNRPGGPIYLSPQMLSQAGEIDVLIAVQNWRPIFDLIPAKKFYFWTGDGEEQHSNLGIGDPRVVQKIEKLFTASNWHKQSLCQRSGFPQEKTTVVGNGIHPPYFSEDNLRQVVRHPRRIIYTSAPYRGLELAAKYFVTLKKELPDLEFHIFSGLSIYDRNQSYQGPHAANFEALKKRLEHTPGVSFHGNILQRELSREYAKSRVLLYPNIVNETCCITALESQAAGCPVIASANSALPESVGNGGFVIEGVPGSEEYSGALLEKLKLLMTNDLFWLEYSAKGRERMFRENTWEAVAHRLEQGLA
jgi:glycosyltransferase involved in cell wall biosynthesis